MLNFVYYPVSFVLWCWHEVFGFIFSDTSAVGWALSIVLLVFTVRAIMLRPAIKQVRVMRKMQRFAPQIRAIQQKYPDDRQRQSAEMRKLHHEHGVNPMAGCLPILLQGPVFIGLSRVLRAFTEYPDRPNYFFPHSDVRSYLAAKLLGAHLGDGIFNAAAVSGTVARHSVWLWQVAPVAIPLMIVAAVATHLNARISVSRPVADNVAPQPALMRVISVWVFPLGVLVFGGALPVGLLLYWVSNNVWTLGQQHLVLGRVDKAEAEQALAVQRLRVAQTPKPGQKPVGAGKQRRLRR